MTLADKIESSKKRHAKIKHNPWVRVQWIIDLTGWDKHKLYDARKQGLIEYKKEGKEYFYNLESINPIFLKNHKTQSV